MMNKVCAKCRESIRLADFYRHTRSKDGLMHICKACHRQAVRANRAANIEYYRAYEAVRSSLEHRVQARADYARTPKGLAAGNKAKRAYLDRNPIKRAAHVICGNAIKSGKLIAKPCEVCGDSKAQAHHDDYSKPLDVRWLCTTHHAEWHKHNTPLCPNQAA